MPRSPNQGTIPRLRARPKQADHAAQNRHEKGIAFIPTERSTCHTSLFLTEISPHHHVDLVSMADSMTPARIASLPPWDEKCQDFNVNLHNHTLTPQIRQASGKLTSGLGSNGRSNEMRRPFWGKAALLDPDKHPTSMSSSLSPSNVVRLPAPEPVRPWNHQIVDTALLRTFVFPGRAPLRSSPHKRCFWYRLQQPKSGGFRVEELALHEKQVRVRARICNLQLRSARPPV